jgi:hypothetical protein
VRQLQLRQAQVQQLAPQLRVLALLLQVPQRG